MRGCLTATRDPETVELAGSAGPMRVHIYRPSEGDGGLAVIAHGRNGAADQPQIVPLIAACVGRGLTVVAPDFCHSSANRSAGASETFTMASHMDDLARVLDWAQRPAASDPVGPSRGRCVVAGHSMGAYAACRLAAERSDGSSIDALLLVSPVVSGAALIAAREAMGPAAVADLRRELPSAFQEWPTHDALPAALGIRVPSAVIVGADDTLTTPSDAARLAHALPRCVAHHVVPGAHHCPSGAAYEGAIARSLDALGFGGRGGAGRG